MVVAKSLPGTPLDAVVANLVDAVNDLQKQMPVVGQAGVLAQYNQAAPQTLAPGANILAWGTANIATPFLVRGASGVGHKFTVLRAGLWSVTACLRTAAANGERHLSLNTDNGGELAASAVRHSFAAQICVSIVVPLVVGDLLSARVWNGTGSSCNTAGTAGQTRFTAAWLHS